MAFSKTFPKTVSGSNYPSWEEVFLSLAEEDQAEKECQKKNFLLMDECLLEARSLAIKKGINTDENVVQLAIALFEKRASHVVFWKEMRAKEKFDEKNRK